MDNNCYKFYNNYLKNHINNNFIIECKSKIIFTV